MEIPGNFGICRGRVGRMKISIVVANHGRDLSALKDSIDKSTHKDVEFIEINRGFERSKQRNMGIQESTGDAILWLDSDQTISLDLLKEINWLLKIGYSSIYIPEIIVGTSFFARIRAFERSFLTGTAVDVPRAILKRCMPLFDESLVGPEDADLGQRIKGLRTTTDSVLYHHDDVSFLEYCRKKAYYTKSMRAYAAKWPKDKCLDLKYRCFTVFVENRKWQKLVRHPILSIGIAFVIIVRGIIYYANR
jgi:glycosyltransferase involved in cell wall biosynthesis